VVGRCEEKADVVGTGKVPQLVMDARHSDKGPLRGRHPAIQPERVMRYKCAGWGFCHCTCACAAAMY